MAMQVFGFLNDLIEGQDHVFDATGLAVPLNSVSGNDDVYIFAPGADVSTVSVVLPVKSEAEARRAVGYAVEDDIAASIEASHFALGPAGSDLQTPRLIQVVSLDLMQSWHDWLSGHPHLHCAKLISGQSLLKSGEIYDVGGGIIGRKHDHVFALDADMPMDVIHALLDGERPVQFSKADLVKHLAARIGEGETYIDLQQGPFKARKSVDMSSFRAWRLSGALAAALAAAWLTLSLIDVSAMRAEQKDIEASIAAAYQKALPDAPQPTNYIRAVSQAVNTRGESGDLTFRDASAALYSALEYISDAQLMGIRYDGEEGELIATIAYSSYGDDAGLKAVLSEIGVTANLGDVRQESIGVVGDVTIRRGQS